MYVPGITPQQHEEHGVMTKLPSGLSSKANEQYAGTVLPESP